SKASATQRAGRAGRTRAGRCLRLYTKADFDQRPAADVPEIRRADLAEAALALHGSGITSLRDFPFFEPPPAAPLEAAGARLQLSGAGDGGGGLTVLGRRLSRFPLHPRQARLIVEAERRGVATDGAVIAALVNERRPARQRREKVSGPSDLLEMLDEYRA